jgi:tetratricopeptide (TPR) repeat protein
MRRTLGAAVLLVCIACGSPDESRLFAQPDAATLAAAEADPVYQQRRRQFNALFQSGDHLAALEAAKQAHRAAPVLRDPYIWVSTLCKQLGRNQEAIRIFRETADVHPELALPWFYKGFNEFHLSQFDDALGSFERAAELNPSDAETWYRQAMIYYTRSDFDTVSRLLEKSYALDPLSEKTVTAWIDVLRIQADEDRATAIIEEALSRLPDSAAIVYRSGLTELNNRDDAAAERAFRRAIELDPAMREPHEHLAGLLSRTGREEESRRQRNISTRLNDYSRNSRLLESRLVDAVDGAIHLLLAEVELTAGETEVALRWFRRALQLGGYTRRNTAGQAEALFRQGRIEQGNRVLTAAKPQSSRALLAQVAREIAADNATLARELLDRALLRAPDEAQFLRRAADYARELGDAARADDLLERSVGAETLSTAPDPE